MAEELLYTSAPTGLHPGSRGYCTVLQSGDLPKRVRSSLESASSYRWAIPPKEDASNETPVNYSHMILRAGMAKQHVLSRVAAYGFDYTHRTNHIAHHVVLDTGELPEAGPAALLSASSFMRSQWNGETQMVSSVSVPRGRATDGKPCTAWARLTGDAGWAGVVAQEVLAGGDRPIYLIFQKDQPLLPLMAEVAMLLPPEKKWTFTFSTYFTDLPSAFDCRCRCVLEDSPECQRAMKMTGSLVVDLSAAGPVPTAGPLVEQARTGQIAAQIPAARPRGMKASPRTRTSPTSETIPIRTPSTSARDHAAADSISVQTTTAVGTAHRRQLTPNNLKWIVAGGAAIVVCIVALAAMLMRGDNGTQSQAADEQPPTTDRVAELTKKYEIFLKRAQELEQEGRYTKAGEEYRLAKRLARNHGSVIASSDKLKRLKQRVEREFEQNEKRIAARQNEGDQLLRELKADYKAYQLAIRDNPHLAERLAMLEPLRKKQLSLEQHRDDLARDSRREYNRIARGIARDYNAIVSIRGAMERMPNMLRKLREQPEERVRLIQEWFSKIKQACSSVQLGLRSFFTQRAQ